MAPSPATPDPDPAAALHDALRRLHRQRGAPSTRTLARRIGLRRISHGTVHTALTGGNVVTWPKLLLIVQALDGDVATFRGLWTAARPARATTPVTTRATATPATATPATPTPITATPAPATVAPLAQLFGVSELTAMLTAYRPPRARAFDVDKVAARLAELEPQHAVRLLLTVPDETAATALARVAAPRLGPIIETLGAQALGKLIAALPAGSAERDLLDRRRPTPAPSKRQVCEAGSGSHVLSMPAVEAAAYLRRNPGLIDPWWRP